jgi:large subunit ribosomal protein L19e
MNLSIQKRLAAEILGCGVNRVRLDPERLEEIGDAITRSDVKRLIDEGAIYRAPETGHTWQRVKERRGAGRRKGAKYSVLSRKERWITRVRAQRRYLSRIRGEGLLKEGVYRHLYLMVKAGRFKSVAELRNYLIENNYLLRGA